MNQEQREVIAFEMIEEAWSALRAQSIDAGLRCREVDPNHTTEDVRHIMNMIDEGWDNFREIWSMGR